MTTQCIYCGMELGDECVEREIEGKKIARFAASTVQWYLKYWIKREG